MSIFGGIPVPAGLQGKTLDDIYNLLNAVNTTTLGRMEAEIKDLRSLVDAINTITLGRIENEIKALQR